MKKRIAVVLVALVLSISCIIGTTLAWLTATTNEVKNTFTYGDINIDLWENKYNQETNSLGEDIVKDTTTNSNYKMIPGTTMPKNPTVTVKAGSEACWLFVEVKEGGSITLVTGKDSEGKDITTKYTFDEFLTYAIATGWTLLKQTPTSETANENETYVYYRTVDARLGSLNSNIDFAILDGHKVSVNTSVTKQMMNEIDGLTYNTDGTITENPAELANRPTLTFKAYAVQSANVTSAEAAWAIANPTT